jgi:hypothetical protein
MAVTMKGMVFWVVMAYTSEQLDVSEEHITSIFSVEE